MTNLEIIIAELHKCNIQFSKVIVLTKKEEQTFSKIDPFKSPKLLFVERSDILELVRRLNKTKKIPLTLIKDFLDAYYDYLSIIREKDKIHLQDFGPFLPSNNVLKPWRKGPLKKNLKFYDLALFFTLLWSFIITFLFVSFTDLSGSTLEITSLTIFLITFCLGLWINIGNGTKILAKEQDYELSKKDQWKQYKTAVIHYLQQINLIYKHHEYKDKTWSINDGNEALFKGSALLLTDKKETSSYLYPNNENQFEINASEVPTYEIFSKNRSVIGRKILEIKSIYEYCEKNFSSKI